MQKLFTTLVCLVLSLMGWAQELSLSPACNSLTITGGRTLTETTTTIGRQFMGYPYVPHTLDVNPTEQLVVNLTQFDCTTYVETVLALSLAWQEQAGRPDPMLFEQTFRKYLTKLRYRDGQINGYASRLHYFSDWLRDNERKGLLTDVTGQLPGAIVVAKPVSYMTASTYKYPHLNDPVIFRQVAQMEADLSRQTFSFIPKKNIRLAETQLREGDIVMLCAARPGLDMKHVGLVVRQPGGQIHLLHASSDRAVVVITPSSLQNYVLSHKYLSGIRVARLRASAPALTAVAGGK